jgi:predicted ATPase
MKGRRFIHSLQIRNLLSYGDESASVELEPLNVLIGSNASGKSNFIEAISLLQAAPTDFPAPIRAGGGVVDLLWKGGKPNPIAQIEAVLDYPQGEIPLRYRINFTTISQRLEILEEFVEDKDKRYPNENDVYFYYRYQNGQPILNIRNSPENSTKRSLRREDLILDQSVLSQRKDPDLYPELSYLSSQFSAIGLYRDWQMGRYSEPRKAQHTDLIAPPLLEDFSNLGLVLNHLQYQLGSRYLIEKLQKFYRAAEELIIRIYGGTVQVSIREAGLVQPIPATRLSDGTLRYLTLLALLCDPNPPPLICLEEPEIGLHPDILPTIAELLVEASSRTQLVVTTHSDALISALPTESVLVCERDSKGSRLRRLDPEKLKDWLDNYALGDIWRMGEIGGNRW